jgi:DNA modification methylase
LDAITTTSIGEDMLDLSKMRCPVCNGMMKFKDYRNEYLTFLCVDGTFTSIPKKILKEPVITANQIKEPDGLVRV